ncbi:MAG: site-specific DNA-methyltransferase [Bacteroidales bacterium]|jgi:DNA modification methylase
MELNKLHTIDALKGLQKLPDSFVDCIVTSPPYWALRDYDVKGQIGMEKTPQEYVGKLLDIFIEAKRVLKKDGTLWVNIGDTYGGSYCGWGNKNLPHKYQTATIKPLAAKIYPKSLLGIPFMFATGMIKNGWLLRNTIIWQKPNAMPESAKDRFTNDFEYLFFFVKSKEYYFNQMLEPLKSSTIERTRYGNNSVKNKTSLYKGFNNDNFSKYSEKIQSGKIKGRNMRTVWEINTKSFHDIHFAVFPEKLVEIPVKTGCRQNGIVLDPFIGSGTTALVAKNLKRKYIGFDLNPEYIKLATKRIASEATSLNGIPDFQMKLINIKNKLKKFKV